MLKQPVLQVAPRRKAKDKDVTWARWGSLGTLEGETF